MTNSVPEDLKNKNRIRKSGSQPLNESVKTSIPLKMSTTRQELRPIKDQNSVIKNSNFFHHVVVKKPNNLYPKKKELVLRIEEMLYISTVVQLESTKRKHLTPASETRVQKKKIANFHRLKERSCLSIKEA